MDKKSILVVVLEALLFLAIISFGYRSMDNKLDISNQNIKAYKGQVEQLELKNGELLRIKDSYILEKNELQEQFDMSKQEIRDLQKKLNSSLAYISRLEANVKIDTIREVRDSIIYINDTDRDVKFKYQDDWFSMEGMTQLRGPNSNTELYNISMDVPLNIGLSDMYQLFVTSPNPYVSFTNMEGALIEGSKLYPKPKRFSMGIQGGFGPGYDIITKQMTLGIYVGFGFQWNITK